MNDLLSKKGNFYSDKEIFPDNSPRIFKGKNLGQIRFPLGGIGTGTISLGGRGELKDWEIFNRPHRDSWLPCNLFILRVSDENAQYPIVRVLEREWLPPYDGTRGIPEQNAPGLPRLQECTFVGEYPFARICFQDDKVPIDIRLEAFNPFIPSNVKDSGLPTVIFIWELTNTSKQPVNIEVYSSLYNACGYHDREKMAGLALSHSSAGQGQNVNRFFEDDPVHGIAMSTEKLSKDHPYYGTMALSTTWPKVEYKLRFDERYGLSTNFQDFWEELEKGRKLPNGPSPKPSPEGKTQIGILGCQAKLEAGEKVRIPFFISWHFPNRNDRCGRKPSPRQDITGNYYTILFKNAWEVARYVGGEFPRLYEESKKFQKAFYASTIPGYALEAITATFSALRTNSCFMDKEGRFFGYEGCRPHESCCPGTCTHVWNYVQSVAYLFPSLERSARQIEFLLNTAENGHMPFRTPVPPGINSSDLISFSSQRFSHSSRSFTPAADGQMGCILRAYREWLISGDDDFLKGIWPNVKKALEFVWQRWDKNQDGIMEEDQHNTTDFDYYGPTPYTTTLYIAALEAGARMANVMNERSLAEKYKKVAESGKRILNGKLWNGEYFEQDLTGWEDKPHQLGRACSSDQIMGQWYADMLGLEDLVNNERLRSTLQAIFSYNWQTDFHNLPNVRRAFAISDEQALLYCTWPRGGKPHHPILRATEAWTGMEYMVASQLIYSGMIKEGLSIVKGIRERHNGERRNPWNECECGDHYVRAMSSWALLLAWSGFHYSAPEKRIQFAPKMSVSRFQTFWSVDGAWGIYRQKIEEKKMSAELKICYGSSKLKKIWLDWENIKSERVILEREGIEKELKLAVESKNGLRITFSSELRLREKDILKIKADR